MNNNQRIEKISELIAQISPVNYNKILLNTKLNFTERQESPNTEEITDLKTQIVNLNEKLAPLFEELRKLQSRYKIEIEGELSRIDGTKYWNTPETIKLNLRTYCQVDTITNTWGPYINAPYINDLILEVHQVVFQQYYSNFNILNIVRI